MNIPDRPDLDNLSDEPAPGYVLNIVIWPGVLGFTVYTHWAKEVSPGSFHGTGFHKLQGLYSAHDLFNALIWTPEPFRVTIHTADRQPRP